MPEIRLVERIARNLQSVRQRIAAAADRVGRQADEITLVAVTKSVSHAEVAALVQCGCRELGESRPQVLWERATACTAADVHWHLVGHLQRNKVRRTLPLVTLIHSVDSLRLLETIDAEAGQLGRQVPVLLEVNISGDEAKHGLAPAELGALLGQAAEWKHLGLRGLMTMAAREGGVDVARRNFADLRTLRDRLQADCPPGVSLAELSMGMSGDLEVAVEEGATMVRIGSALFEGL